MGLYKTICYKVEDSFVKLITKKNDLELVLQKVDSYRKEKEAIKASKKLQRK